MPTPRHRVIMPISPWLASAGCTKNAVVPVLARVAAILLPTWPDFTHADRQPRGLCWQDQLASTHEIAVDIAAAGLEWLQVPGGWCVAPDLNQISGLAHLCGVGESRDYNGKGAPAQAVRQFGHWRWRSLSYGSKDQS